MEYRESIAVVSCGLFHPTEEEVRTHAQGVCESAQGLCIREPVAVQDRAYTSPIWYTP